MRDDAGRISRRALLVGAAGAVVVLGGGAAGADYEIDQHPTWRAKLFGCGSEPALPSRGSYTVHTGAIESKAMGRSMPYSVAMTASNDLGQQPLVLALPGEGASSSQIPDAVGLPNYANAIGLFGCIVSPGDVGSSYYHPRNDGTDMLTFLLDELVPHIERALPVGGSRATRALYGLSMGGYGALLLAQRRPDMFCAAAVASPAVFPTYQAAITGHPGTFDSESDWQRYGVWDQRSAIGSVPIRIDCGDADPFAATARHLLDDIPGAVGSIGSGCHDIAFWRKTAAQDLAFLKSHLPA
ncbi:MAG TPA: alpha/beta hydrolase-fold protein [Mycobacteriales bacterium]|nr:alpha/beta hydrolase-fold protein [Mycobacteriales bacterium]